MGVGWDAGRSGNPATDGRVDGVHTRQRLYRPTTDIPVVWAGGRRLMDGATLAEKWWGRMYHLKDKKLGISEVEDLGDGA